MTVIQNEELESSELDFSEVEIQEELDSLEDKQKRDILKKVFIFVLAASVMVFAVWALYYFLNVYTNKMIKLKTETSINNYGFNSDKIFYEGKYLVVTKESGNIIIRPKNKKFALDYSQWINKYFTITDETELEITDGSLQEYSFEVYFLKSSEELKDWSFWMHGEVYRNIVIVSDAKADATEEELVDMASTFIKNVEPMLNKGGDKEE